MNKAAIKSGFDKDLTISPAKGITHVDGVAVRKVQKTRIYVSDADKEVAAVMLTTIDGESHFLWNPDDTP